MKPIKNRQPRGDTILEVLLSMTILALVVGAAYALSSNSFQSGLNAQYRNQGISYAQQQLEFIKNADHQGQLGMMGSDSNYTQNPGTAFCIDYNQFGKYLAAPSSGLCPLPIGEADPSRQSIFSVVDVYNGSDDIGDPGPKTFKAKVVWEGANGHPQQVILYYKPSDSYVPPPGGP